MKILTRYDKAWLCGYACALANVSRLWNEPQTVVETMKCDGITVEELTAAGVESYDLDEIRRCHARRARKKVARG